MSFEKKCLSSFLLLLFPNLLFININAQEDTTSRVKEPEEKANLTSDTTQISNFLPEASPFDSIILEVDDAKIALDSIAKSSKKTSINTTPTYFSQHDWDEFVILFLSLVAAAGTLLTWKGIKATTRTIQIETEKQLIKSDIQKQILIDLIRHFFRNKIIVCTTRLKLENEGFDKFYPSEEHLLKLKVLPEDQRFDKFDNIPQHYNQLHMLELKFRNYNIEIDVTLEHLKSRQISDEVKKRDLDVLEFKSQLLTQEILELMQALKFDWKFETVSNNLRENSKYYKTNKIDGSSAKSIEEQIDIDVPKRDKKRDFYDKTLGLTEYVDEDIKIEYAIINLIPFPET
ncbi:MAG: hypothetical protein WD431_01350 [Cyclobacteriaceae bacterium]